MMNMRRFWFSIVAGLSIAGIGVYYGTRNKTAPASVVSQGLSISPYTPARDRQDIIDLFHRNMYWLTTNQDYSVEHMLDTRSPNDYDVRNFGKFHIKVMRQGDAFIGFVGYYMKNFYEGTILFLAVHEDFRGKHYGEQLVMDAIAELRKMGASTITLLTWLHNKRSRALYERMGFVESSHDDAIIYYRYAK